MAALNTYSVVFNERNKMLNYFSGYFQHYFDIFDFEWLQLH